MHKVSIIKSLVNMAIAHQNSNKVVIRKLQNKGCNNRDHLANFLNKLIFQYTKLYQVLLRELFKLLKKCSLRWAILF